MRRDQALFLGVGIVLGLFLGLLFGVLVSRPEALGAAPAATPVPPSAMTSGAGADPHAVGGMESVTTQLAAFRQRLQANPNDVESLVGIGELYLQANMRDRALEALGKAASLAGNDAMALTRIAAALAIARESRTAFDLARRAMTLEQRAPEPAELATNIALKGLADPVAATETLAEMRRRAPSSPAVIELERQLDAVKRVFQTAAERPNDPSAQIALGNVLYDAGRWPDAEAAYRRALAAGSEDANAITDLGFVLSEQGKTEDALKHFDLALQKNPQQWQAALNGTVVSLNTGDRDRARAWLGRLKTINPQHPSIPQFEQQVAAGR